MTDTNTTHRTDALTMALIKETRDEITVCPRQDTIMDEAINLARELAEENKWKKPVFLAAGLPQENQLLFKFQNPVHVFPFETKAVTAHKVKIAATGDAPGLVPDDLPSLQETANKSFLSSTYTNEDHAVIRQDRQGVTVTPKRGQLYKAAERAIDLAEQFQGRTDVWLMTAGGPAIIFAHDFTTPTVIRALAQQDKDKDLMPALETSAQAAPEGACGIYRDDRETGVVSVYPLATANIYSKACFAAEVAEHYKNRFTVMGTALTKEHTGTGLLTDSLLHIPPGAPPSEIVITLMNIRGMKPGDMLRPITLMNVRGMTSGDMLRPADDGQTQAEMHPDVGQTHVIYPIIDAIRISRALEGMPDIRFSFNGRDLCVNARSSAEEIMASVPEELQVYRKTEPAQAQPSAPTRTPVPA